MTAAGRGVRNAFRHPVRTVSVVVILGLAIGLCFVMLIAERSVSGQVTTTLRSIGTTVTISLPGSPGGRLPGRNLTTAELAPVARLRGVTGVDEILSGTAASRGTARTASAGTSLRAGGSGPVVYFSGSTQPANPVGIGAPALRIVSGHVFPGTSPAAVAMVSTAMARENRLTVGSAFTAYGTTLTVAAIFASDSPPGRGTVVTPLPVLERLTGETNQVSMAVVTVASLTGLAAATATIERTLGPVASVTSNLAAARQAAGDLGRVTSIARYSLAGAVLAAAAILFLVMVMTVRERKREIGILKAIGARSGAIMTQFTAESATFTLLGLVVGTAAGSAAGGAATSALVSRSGASSAAGGGGLPGGASPFLRHLTGISAHAGGEVILGALAAAVVIALLASTATTWLISRIQPADALRSE